MSAQLEFVGQIVRTQNGTVDHIPSRPAIYTPKKIVTIGGTMSEHKRRVTIPKRTPTDPQPAPTLLWKWEAGKPMFSSFLAQTSDASGFVYLILVPDKPTSASDLTPLMTHRNNPAVVPLSCWSPFHLNHASTLVHASQSIAAGIDADDYPAIATDLGTESGYIYEIWARSSSTEADVPIDFFVDG